MKYYAGIDGGGSKTKLMIINEQKKVIYLAEGGPTSIDTVPLSVIEKTIHDLFSNFQESKFVDAIFAGLGGVASASDQANIMDILRRLPVYHPSTLLGADNDVKNALVGSLGHDQGMVLIAGTGSAVYGHNQQNNWRSGGISAKEGDPGSAYDLGFQALRHLGKVLDGRCPMTAFAQDLIVTLNITNFQTLAAFFNQSHRTQIATIAPIVTRNNEDQFAQTIIRQAVMELVLMVTTVYNHLGFEKIELGLVGSLANANTPFKTSLIQAIQFALPQITVIAPPRFEPAFGSALLAYHLKTIE
jgi:N-acetylglucosamine kinase